MAAHQFSSLPLIVLAFSNIGPHAIAYSSWLLDAHTVGEQIVSGRINKYLRRAAQT